MSSSLDVQKSFSSKFSSNPQAYLSEGEGNTICEVTLDKEVYVMRLVNGGNAFKSKTCRAMLTALNDIENDYLESVKCSEEPGLAGALVVTGKKHVFSSGMDGSVFFEPEDQEASFILFQDLLLKLFSFKLPTVAAINGHVFAAGWVFASAFDYRVMRSDRGYICMNEVDMPFGLAPAIFNTVKCKIKDVQSLRTMCLEGKKFSGEEALKLKFVDQLASGEQVILSAIDLARIISTKVTKSTEIYSFLRMEMYSQTVASLKVYNLGYMRNHKIAKL